MFDILQDRYSQNEQIIERIGIGLATESDTMAFFNLIRDVYEVAFTKCVNEQKEQLAKLGYQVKIVAETKK